MSLITAEQKPSNTEVLGLLLDEEKLKFITNLHPQNIKGLLKTKYLFTRLNNPDQNSFEIHNEIMQEYLALKCSIIQKKGNRSDQIVDALKHIINDESSPDITNLVKDLNK